MNNCEIIKDLLPLYKDEVVSASSIEMIEEHLKTCEICNAELAKLQGEVRISYSPEQKSEIGAFRLLKKKLLKRNAIVACTSAVVVVALILGTYLSLDRARTIIPYNDSLIVAVNTNPERGTIDIVSSIKPAGWNVNSTAVSENGENVRLVFVTFRESVISRWQNNRSGDIEFSLRVVQPMTAPQPDPEDKPGSFLIYEPFDRYEIYYIDERLSDAGVDYSRLRDEGILLSSGTFGG